MKTKANSYLLIIILIISTLSCKKEEELTPEKLFIGKWKVINVAKYKNGTGTPFYDLYTVNVEQKYTFVITESKFSVLENTQNNKVYDETIYVFKDGTVWGYLQKTNYLGFTGEAVKVTFESNDKMSMRLKSSSDINEWTYRRIQ